MLIKRLFKTVVGKYLFLLLCILVSSSLNAQCKYKNTAFKSGESLTYDLYFNWKFVWVKCGSTHFKIENSTYNGKEALHTHLLFKSNKKCESIFPMRDTLVSYSTPELVPLYFRKGAHEGKRYTMDEVWYSYPAANKTVMKQKYIDPDGVVLNHQSESIECVNDMLNILLLARSYDYSNFVDGQRMYFKMVTGKRLSNQVLVFKGRTKFKANDGHSYHCLVFSLLNDKDKKKEKELLKFYITDDKNHLPVRIDFNLKFGIAKAFLLNGKGLRNPQTSIIK